MADVTARSDDRAQLLIVAAIGIAVLLVLLTMALNTAVYGGAHVPQTDTDRHEERAVVQYQESLRRAVTGLATSGTGNGTEYDEVESDLRTGVEEWDELTTAEQLRDGAVTTASITNITFESRIIQDDHGTFEDRTNSSGWILASNVSAVDAFEMAVHDESLVATADCAGDDGCFTVRAEGANGTVWRLFVSAPADTEGVELAVVPSNGTVEDCETTAASARVDVADGAFTDESETCEFTSFTADDGIEPPYTVTYANAGNVTGTYDLTATGTIVENTIEADDRYETTGSPRVEPRIGAANVSIEYRSPDLTYRTEIRVTPEADDD